MTTAAVISAEQQLQQAKAEEERVRRADAAVKLKEVMAQGRAAQKKFQKLHGVINEANQQVTTLHNALVEARDQIAFYSTPLDVTEFPSNAEIAEHTSQLGCWQVRQKKLLAQHSAAQATQIGSKMEATRLGNQISQLKNAAHNLRCTMRGEKPFTKWEGSLEVFAALGR